jgi:DMSO/TMAO reductase YedYZ molybdopterin-dependent catalytic subunit
MDSHQKARSCPASRGVLGERVLRHGSSVREAAAWGMGGRARGDQAVAPARVRGPAALVLRSGQEAGF